MLFPFSLGMLMSRNFKPMKVNGAFWICTIILIALFFISLGIAHFLSGQLGGLTGDTYGFLTECGHVIYMLAAVYLLR